MKFFIFTCLLAVALATHMEHVSSSEESINVSQEKYTQEKNVVIHPSKNICSTSCAEAVRNTNEVEYSSSSSSKEFAEVPGEEVKVTMDDKRYLKELSEISQFYQKFPQYIQSLYQGPIVMNPWGQVKRIVKPFIPTGSGEQVFTNEESAGSSQEENQKETVDMESTEIFTKKNTLTEEEKNRLKFLYKINQYYQKFTWPQYLTTISQYQKTMKPWYHFKTNVTPYLRCL